MFTAPSTNPQHRPAARIRPSRELRGPWSDLPSSRVHTSTLKPVNFIRGELLAMPLQPVNMFVHQHVNSAARHKNNSSSPEPVNMFAGGTSRQVGMSSRQRVHRQTRKPVSKTTCEPANLAHTQTRKGVNMSPKFRCKRVNTLTTSMVHS
jgi:hypothetical protein